MSGKEAGFEVERGVRERATWVGKTVTEKEAEGEIGGRKHVLCPVLCLYHN